MEPHQSKGVEKRFIFSIALTSLILVAEVIGGIWTGSLALLSDAGHVFMDIFALALSYIALRLSTLPPDNRHSYGYHRLEVFAALANGLTLLVIAVGIFYEAVQRFMHPTSVKSMEMLIIAAIGLVVNMVVAFALNGHTHEPGAESAASERKDLNLHSAFLHVLGDMISSVGVILAALLISWTGLQWIDPLTSVLIGVIISVSSVRVLRGSLHILIEGVPEDLSLEAIEKAIVEVPNVKEVHDLHVWSLCSGRVALSAHVVCCDCSGADATQLMNRVHEMVAQKFGIQHTTIQVEPGCTCGGAPVCGTAHLR